MIRGYVTRLRQWYFRYERQLSSAALVFGFIVDHITLKRIDLLFENIVLFTHLSIAGVAIVFVNLYEGGRLQARPFFYARMASPLFMQFSFGALFSAYFIFYSQSASLAASWPFLLFILALLVGNEFFRARYHRLIFQVSVFYITLFSFLIFYVPILAGAMGVWVFLVSGAASLLLMWALLSLLARLIPDRIRANRRSIKFSVLGIFFFINALYFTNIIPPIPLSLKEADVYHYVSRTGDGRYFILREDEPWYEAALPYETIHIRKGDPVYFYSAVFAPTDLKTRIVHEWQYRDEESGEWVTLNRIPYSISGGRDGGYRGFSLKRAVFPGMWRVDVKTERGALLGRVRFIIKEVPVKPELHEDYQ